MAVAIVVKAFVRVAAVIVVGALWWWWQEALFPKCDEISSSSLINLFANHRLSAVSLRLTAGSDRQPGGWSAPATLDGPVGVASTTTTTKLKLFQT